MSDKKKLVKTLLSWDVGIKNLAYAIVAFYDDNTNEIIDMDVINTVDFREICCFTLRGGKQCQQVAQTVFKIKERDDNELYYCKTHVKKANFELSTLNVNKTKCCKCKKECNQIVNGTEYGWCHKHCEKEIDVYKRRCVKKFSQDCNKQSLTKIGHSMFTKLDNHPNIEKMFNVDQVLIELQPVKKNANMKSVAMELLSYFTLRGITEKRGKYNKNIVTGVTTVLASGKLKVDKKTTDEQLGKVKKNVVYYATKNLGKIYAKHLMQQKDIDKLITYKKYDDMCDAYLQAISYHYGTELPDEMKVKLENAHKEVIELENKIKNKK